jgi:hypothetical protein
MMTATMTWKPSMGSPSVEKLASHWNGYSRVTNSAEVLSRTQVKAPDTSNAYSLVRGKGSSN